jgi:hypothetical protein
MQARDERMRRLGQGADPSSVEARAAAFLAEARPTLGLTQAEMDAIERRLERGRRARLGLLLWPALAAIALLLLGGSVLAVVGGWPPRWPFLDRGEPTDPAPPAVTRPARRAAYPPPPAVVSVSADEGTPVVAPAASAAPPVARRSPRGPSASAPAAASVDDRRGQLSAEARSLSDALARWRRHGDAESALALLAAHDRRFADGALAVEAKVARAEILLAVGRRAPALAVLDSLSLAGLPRARELATLRGELRAEAGRCPEARADLGPVLEATAQDDLGRRAVNALGRCP